MAVHNNRRYGILFLFVLAIAGCGSNAAPNLAAVSTLEASQECINCHETTAVSSVTGERITDAWQLSSHNTSSGANRSGRGASCGDCHEPEAGHPNSCYTCHGGGTPARGPLVQHNPDLTLKCGKCHSASNTLSFGNDTTVQRMHYSNLEASFVSSQFVGKCRSCHNPHNPSAKIVFNRQWADSGHGDTLATPWNRDFKTMGTAQPVATTFQSLCVRCHTATGFINYINSGLTDQHAWGNASDPTKQVLACPACHDDGNGNAYSFKVRQVSFNGGGIRVYYNYSSPTANAGAPATYPTIKLNNQPQYFEDLGLSNLCMVCHVGRLIGQVIKDAAVQGLNFTKIARMGAHDFSGGATVFQKSGYEYAGRDYSKPAYFQHELIGRGDFKGTGTKGPCIACHMNSSSSHSYLPVVKTSGGIITQIVSRTCPSCHSGVNAWTATGLETQKSGFLSTMAALYELQLQKGTAKSRPNPPSASIPYTTNWETLYGAGSGPNTMGSSFNFDLFKNDPGAFAHNSLYTRRILYDSIDWLNNGILDDDVEAAIASLPAATDFNSLAATYRANYKTLAINYLLGGSGGGRPAP